MLLKSFNYFAFRAVLPYEVRVGSGLRLWHRGLGVVVHPNTVIGKNVSVAHGVTIAGTPSGTTYIGDNVTIGAGAQIIPKKMRPYVIGEGAIIGAGSTVVGDVPAGSIARGDAARIYSA